MIPPASFAVALAIIVFPHPGGPYNKTPIEKELNCHQHLQCHFQTFLTTTERAEFIVILG